MSQGEQMDPGTEDYQDDAGHSLMTNLKMTIRADCTVSAYNPFLLFKALASLDASAGGEVGEVSL